MYNSSTIIENIKWFMFDDGSKEIRNETGFTHDLRFVGWTGNQDSFIVEGADGAKYNVCVSPMSVFRGGYNKALEFMLDEYAGSDTCFQEMYENYRFPDLTLAEQVKLYAELSARIDGDNVIRIAENTKDAVSYEELHTGKMCRVLK